MNEREPHGQTDLFVNSDENKVEETNVEDPLEEAEAQIERTLDTPFAIPRDRNPDSPQGRKAIAADRKRWEKSDQARKRLE